MLPPEESRKTAKINIGKEIIQKEQTSTISKQEINGENQISLFKKNKINRILVRLTEEKKREKLLTSEIKSRYNYRH